MKFWFFLTILLDVYPWIFLQFQPFRGKLRYPAWVVGVLIVLLMLPCQLAIVWIGLQSWGNLDILSVCRMGQLLMTVLLSLWLIRDQMAKIIFVAGMVMPISMFVVTLSGFFKTLIPVEAPVYMVTSLLRLGMSCLLYPPMRRLWAWNLAPSVEFQDGELWKYSWPLPMTVTCVTILYTHTGIEVYGVNFTEVLVRLCLLSAIFFMAIMVFRISRRTEERIRMAEEVERNRLLISAHKEQYGVMAKGIQKIQSAERTRALEEIRALARAGEQEKVLACVDRLLEAGEDSLIPDQRDICEYYQEIARQEGIPVTMDVNIPEDLAIDPLDLSILLGSLFENAVEASRKLPAEQRQIEITAARKRGVLKIQFRNRFAGEIRQINGRILSQKCDFAQPGVGLSTVWAVADKYGGELRIEHAGGFFTVNAALPEADEE